MSPHNIYFCQEIRKMQYFWVERSAFSVDKNTAYEQYLAKDRRVLYNRNMEDL